MEENKRNSIALQILENGSLSGELISPDRNECLRYYKTPNTYEVKAFSPLPHDQDLCSRPKEKGSDNKENISPDGQIVTPLKRGYFTKERTPLNDISYKLYRKRSRIEKVLMFTPIAKIESPFEKCQGINKEQLSKNSNYQLGMNLGIRSLRQLCDVAYIYIQHAKEGILFIEFFRDWKCLSMKDEQPLIWKLFLPFLDYYWSLWGDLERILRPSQ